MKLICLPFAGGSARSFLDWKKYFGKEIDLVAIDYAGRGNRFCEELTESFHETLDDIYPRIVKEIDTEYAIFGHSMGALYAYEIAKKLEQDGLRKPLKVIVSATRAPYIQDDTIMHEMSRMEFMHELYELGGMPKEIMNDAELEDLFYPILFSDIKNLELYRMEHETEVPQKLSLPLVVLCGTTDDEFDKEDAKKWGDYSVLPISIREFEGGHFFINDRLEEVCDFLKEILL